MVIMQSENNSSSHTLCRESYRLAYRFSQGQSPCVIFCAGFNSSMQGDKAKRLEQYCQSRGQAFLRFDYQAHGESSGDFAQGSISIWLADTVAMIDHVLAMPKLDKVLLVGSSMGAWLALLATLQRRSQVSGLLLIAGAFEMTRYYAERLKGLAVEQDQQGRQFYSVPNNYDDQQPYRIYQHLLDDGKTHVLSDEITQLKLPIHLLHGMQDEVIPWQRSESLIQRLTAAQAKLTLVNDGDHRLSKKSDLALLCASLELLLSCVECV